MGLVSALPQDPSAWEYRMQRVDHAYPTLSQGGYQAVGKPWDTAKGREAQFAAWDSQSRLCPRACKKARAIWFSG